MKPFEFLTDDELRNFTEDDVQFYIERGFKRIFVIQAISEAKKRHSEMKQHLMEGLGIEIKE